MPIGVYAGIFFLFRQKWISVFRLALHVCFLRLVALCADGATVNGIQRGGRPVSHPFTGGNLAYVLQQFKSEHSQVRYMSLECSTLLKF